MGREQFVFAAGEVFDTLADEGFGAEVVQGPNRFVGDHVPRHLPAAEFP